MVKIARYFFSLRNLHTIKKNEFITFNLFKGCFAFGIIDVRFEAILTTTVFNPPLLHPIMELLFVIKPPFAVDGVGAALHCIIAINFTPSQVSLTIFKIKS